MVIGVQYVKRFNHLNIWEIKLPSNETSRKARTWSWNVTTVRERYNGRYRRSILLAGFQINHKFLSKKSSISSLHFLGVNICPSSGISVAFPRRHFSSSWPWRKERRPWLDVINLIIRVTTCCSGVTVNVCNLHVSHPKHEAQQDHALLCDGRLPRRHRGR